MTFIWTVISAHGVVQVSDRLVSRGGVPIDPAANKTVLAYGRDGLITISCTGLAALEGLPTDVWVAHQIAGLPTGRDGRSEISLFRMQRLPQYLDVGQSVNALRVGLDRALRGPLSQYSQTFSIAGWQWSRRTGRARRIGWAVDKRPYAATKATSFIERRATSGTFLLTAAPMPPPFSNDEITTLQDALRPALSDLQQCADILATSIRVGATRWPTIGSNCMAITLPPPMGTATAHCRYIPASWADDDWVTFYTPAVISGDQLIAYSSRVSLIASAARAQKEAGQFITLGEAITLGF